MKIKDLTEKALNGRSKWTGLLLIVIAILFLEAISLVQAYYAQKGVRQEAQARAEGQLRETRSKILDIINQAESAVRNSIWVAQWCLNVPDSLHNIPKLIVAHNPVVAGSTIAIVPDYYKSRPLFAPYVARTKEGMVSKSLATEEYDYPSQEWFTRPIELKDGYWSEPYLDTGGGDILMTTYSVPIRDSKGRIAAVLTADLDLEWLTELVENIKIYPNAFSTVVSRTGQIIVSPAETLVMKTTIDEFARKVEDSVNLKKLNRAMLNGESGNMRVGNEGEKNMVYFAPIDRTGWAMNIFIPEKEMFAGLRKVNHIIRILQFLGLFLIVMIFRSVARSQLKLKAVSEKKEKMENELQIASDIQMSMIPKIFPPFPNRKDIDMAADIVPAKEVGGDMYDFFIRDEKLFFCIGDVSGKGVPASLVMAVTRSLFRSVSAHIDSPASIVSSINDSMAEMNESNMFVTFLCCVLDLSNGQMKYCNAGHNAPLLFTDKIASLEVIPNLPLGIFKGMAYQEQEITLHYDDAIFLYTDGITEAENEAHELFGIERLKNTLAGKRGASQHLKKVQAAVADFVKGAPQSDDLTMLFIHFLNWKDTSTSDTIPENSEEVRTLSLTNDIQQIHKLSEFIDSVAEYKNLSPTLTSSINLAMEEAVTNVIVYAYKNPLTGKMEKDMPIEVQAIIRQKEMEFVIKDSGQAFDPTAVPTANINAKAEDRSIGGLGIHLYKNIMDNIKYSRKDGQNILTLTKRI